jgi:hypothetical protein
MMRGALSTINEEKRSCLMYLATDLRYRVDGAKGIGNVCDSRDANPSFTQDPGEIVYDELTVVVQFEIPDYGPGFLSNELPRNNV